MVHCCGKLVIWQCQSCDLIVAWKFLSAGPKIRPKFTRPFSSLDHGGGVWARDYCVLVWVILSSQPYMYMYVTVVQSASGGNLVSLWLPVWSTLHLGDGKSQKPPLYMYWSLACRNKNSVFCVITTWILYYYHSPNCLAPSILLFDILLTSNFSVNFSIGY